MLLTVWFGNQDDEGNIMLQHSTLVSYIIQEFYPLVWIKLLEYRIVENHGTSDSMRSREEQYRVYSRIRYLVS